MSKCINYIIIVFFFLKKKGWGDCPRHHNPDPPVEEHRPAAWRALYQPSHYRRPEFFYLGERKTSFQALVSPARLRCWPLVQRTAAWKRDTSWKRPSKPLWRCWVRPGRQPAGRRRRRDWRSRTAGRAPGSRRKFPERASERDKHTQDDEDA